MRDRLIRAHREGFPFGETQVTREDDLVGMEFSIHRLGDGELIDVVEARESVWVLMDGEARVALGAEEHRARRASLFDEAPTALSVSAGTRLTIESRGRSEWAVASTRNERAFEPRFFAPEELRPEYRGKGLAQDMSLRNVRLVFDWRERPESRFVVGEVVSYPGRWSSYPPHHHPQPELYHYRFTEPQGYGHAELDEHVFKVRSYDTIQIGGGETHAQVCAPGYGMYYLWIIRHLDGHPYRGFEHAPEHRWMLNPENQGWRPFDGSPGDNQSGDGQGDGNR